VQVFWDEKAHFIRPVTGAFTFFNGHAMGLTNVLSAWVRPEVMARKEFADKL
jgi:hypothetical protein